MQNQGGGDRKAALQEPPLRLQVVPPPELPRPQILGARSLGFKRLTDVLVRTVPSPLECFFLELPDLNIFLSLMNYTQKSESETSTWLSAPKGVRT